MCRINSNVESGSEDEWHALARFVQASCALLILIYTLTCAKILAYLKSIIINGNEMQKVIQGMDIKELF